MFSSLIRFIQTWHRTPAYFAFLFNFLLFCERNSLRAIGTTYVKPDEIYYNLSPHTEYVFNHLIALLTSVSHHMLKYFLYHKVSSNEHALKDHIDQS